MNKSHDARDAILYDILGVENKKLTKQLVATLTLNNLEKEMNRTTFPKGLIKEMRTHFTNIIDEEGENEFSKRMYNLHFQIPEPYEAEDLAEHVYNRYGNWIEREIVNLENETALPWQEQSADLENVSTAARKVQLVLRHRISDVVLNILDLAE